MQQDADYPLKNPVPSHDYNIFMGNSMTPIQKRDNKLLWMTPHCRVHSDMITDTPHDHIPIRMSEQVINVRSEKMSTYGKRGSLVRGVGKSRWWHQLCDDPFKTIKFNNLHFLPEELINYKDIVNLQLTGCRLGDHKMNLVSEFIKESNTVKRVSLQGNAITSEGCKALFKGLCTSCTLIEIDISLNPIGDDGCASICNALIDNLNSRVYKLDVSTCQLTSRSGFYIASLLHNHKRIQQISAWRNSLGVVNGVSGNVTGIPSGALLIMEELLYNRLHNGNFSFLDITANGLIDSDFAAHCTWLNRLPQCKVLEDHTKDYNEFEGFQKGISRYTSGLEVPFRIRLILKGNPGILPSTMNRLSEYYNIVYDVSQFSS